jgi:hypothetical protein
MKQLARFIFLVSTLAIATAHAESVGRTRLELPGSGWTVLAAYETTLKFNGGQYSIPVENKVFQLPGPDGSPKALLTVSSTKGGNRTPVQWISDRCPAPRPKYFTEDFGANRSSRVNECLVVNSAFSPAEFFKGNQKVLKALDEKGVRLFNSGYSLRTVYGANGGTILRVNLITRNDFKGLAGSTPSATATYDVAPALLAWGEALHKAVKDAVLSPRGNLVLPEIAFKDK